MPRRTVLVTHRDCFRHDNGPEHPEGSERLPGIVRAIDGDDALRPLLDRREATPATEEDLLRVHTREHVDAVRAAVALARREQDLVHLDPDTPVSPLSWDSALAAAGCAITATALVLDGAAPTAFALSRPPGHHATASRAMGFCVFNNVAVAARWAQAARGVGRVLVVDWDVHHGNGTQEIFYRDPSVYLLSLHLWPHYPGTGAEEERGAGEGEGTTRNVPLPYGVPAAEYRRRFDEALAGALAEFHPELVIASAGFDCLAGDPLGGLGLEPSDLHALATEILDRTRSTARGRCVAVLEGGYVPQRSGAAAAAVLRAFAGLPPAVPAPPAVHSW